MEVGFLSKLPDELFLLIAEFVVQEEGPVSLDRVVESHQTHDCQRVPGPMLQGTGLALTCMKYHNIVTPLIAKHNQFILKCSHGRIDEDRRSLATSFKLMGWPRKYLNSKNLEIHLGRLWFDPEDDLNERYFLTNLTLSKIGGLLPDLGALHIVPTFVISIGNRDDKAKDLADLVRLDMSWKGKTALESIDRTCNPLAKYFVYDATRDFGWHNFDAPAVLKRVILGLFRDFHRPLGHLKQAARHVN